MTKYIAFYLPQFHPIKENDEWYGKGFTEWRNVASAKPLFKGHYQPHVPADLGFYDLRLKESIYEQAKLAKEYNIYGFCFWHYWFRNDKELLETPFNILLNSKDININFSLAWANHDWLKKEWNSNCKDSLLIKQEYNGIEEYKQHFYSCLKAFKDKRYIRIDNKPIFVIYDPIATIEIKIFIETWRELAKKEGLNGIYFIAHSINGNNIEQINKYGYDGIYDDRMLEINNHQSFIHKAIRKVLRSYFGIPVVFEYRKAIDYMIDDISKNKDVFPVVVPNWDHSPRSKTKNIIFKNCEPCYFKKLLENAQKNIENKEKDHKIVFIKSWNEWGEGNHMEPDIKYGRGYLEKIKEISNTK